MEDSSFIYYLGLGTNLGNKEQNLRDAVQKIEERIGKVVSLSAFYATVPWGFDSANGFLNAACRVDTREVLMDTPQLKLPHPLIHLRDFVMKPLKEIAPELTYSILSKQKENEKNRIVHPASMGYTVYKSPREE